VGYRFLSRISTVGSRETTFPLRPLPFSLQSFAKENFAIKKEGVVGETLVSLQKIELLFSDYSKSTQTTKQANNQNQTKPINQVFIKMSTEQIIVNDVAIQTSVAPIEVPPVEVAVKQTKEKKPKKVSDTPKLAPRFQKFIDFGLWVALQLKNKNLINDEVFQTILTDIKMNDQVDVQTDFYTNYEKSGKPTVSPDAPSLSADGQEVKPKAKKSRKPTGRDSTPDAPSLSADGEEVKPKAKKSRKPTGRDSTPDAPSLPVEGVVEGVQVEKPKAAKKARKPKVVVSDATEAVPVEAVQVDGTEAVPVEKPKAKRVRKPKAVVSDATEAVPQEVLVEGTEGAPVEEKSKAKKARKPKVVSSDATETQIIQSIPVEGITGEDKPKAKKSRKPKASSPLSNSNDIIHDLLSHAISYS
jgi:hypothetical protein